MKNVSLFLLAALVALPTLAQTAPSRVAVINVQKVLAESTVGKAALEKLKKSNEEKTARGKAMTEEITKLEADIKQKQLSLGQDKLEEMARQLSDKKIAIQRFAQDAEKELREQQEKSLQELERKIMPVIQEIGKEMGFALIFNKFESGLIYVSDAVDITDVVLKKFNETAK